MGVTLSYDGSRAAPPAESLLRMVRRLRLREQLRFARIVFLFLLGVPACFLAPLLVSFMLIGTGAGWRGLFWGTSAAVIPLLFVYVHLTRSYTVFDLIRDLRGATALETLVDITLETEAPHVLFPLEVLSIGARATLRATRELLARSRLRHVPLGQVAQTLRLLLPYEQGSSTAELAAKTDDIRGTLDAVIYLVFHGWAELSANRRRVWVVRHLRESLGETLSTPRVEGAQGSNPRGRL